MTPDDYEGWYHSSRGKWIGDVEFQLVRKLLQPTPGGTLLDVGCGTGYFTRRLAGECSLRVLGLDPNTEWLAFAWLHGVGTEAYCGGRAEQLPFADASFDYAISIAALCFVDTARRAIRELLRVSRRRFVIGLLQRHSVLFRQKDRNGGTGAYRGAHWHTVGEIGVLLRGLPVANATIRTAVLLPGGTFLRARWRRQCQAGSVAEASLRLQVTLSASSFGGSARSRRMCYLCDPKTTIHLSPQQTFNSWLPDRGSNQGPPHDPIRSYLWRGTSHLSPRVDGSNFI